MNRWIQAVPVALICGALSPAVFAADEPANAPDGARIEKVVVRADAMFDFDRSTVRPEDQDKILGELGRAGKVAWQSVNAVGYTDSVGTPTYNQALSERRANAIKALLVSKGVDGGMIATAGRASGDPVADNDTAEGRARNRRTAIEFQGVRTLEP